ncbi:MAG: hypothetical protein IKT55_05150 [Clostridia bacterium]|nr:hypothetical protein [Clostridia bacterium]
MNKEQIEIEIRRYKRYVNRSEDAIDNYNAKIRKLEKEYDQATTAGNRMQDHLESYARNVLSALNRLDRDSVFKEYYNQKMRAILEGREREEFFDRIRKGKQDILREIDEYESQIAYERRKICDYNNKLLRLRQQLNSL